MKPGLAVIAGGTCGFQPVTCPDSAANMNRAGRLSVPFVTTKSVVLLKTCPVGAPPGIATSRGTLFRVLPFTSPMYRSLKSAPLDDTQNAAPAGLNEIPHALIKCGSRMRATPGWSDTRSVAR